MQLRLGRDGIVLGLAALAGGALASGLGLPGGWLLGPLLATALLAGLRGLRATLPPPLLLAAYAVIGIAVSVSLSSATLRTLGQRWPIILLVVGCLLLLSVLIGLALAASGRLDTMTAVLGMLPGGASAMVALSDAVGADARVVTVLQYLRLLLVIVAASVVPPLLWPLAAVPPPTSFPPEQTWSAYAVTALAATAGAWLGLRLRLPAGALVGPSLVGAVLGAFDVPHGAWPPGVLQAAFLVAGMSVGLRFDAPALRAIGRLLPLLLGATLLLIVLSGLFAWGLAAVTGEDSRSIYLAASPGGLDSVVVVALASGADVALVLAVNLLRFFAVLLLGPPAMRLLARSEARRQPQKA